MRGAARLELRCVRPGGRALVLDSHPTLEVRGATLLPPPCPPGAESDADAGGGQELPFETLPFASYGSALRIALPREPRPGDLLALRIDYEAGEGPGVRGGRGVGEGPRGGVRGRGGSAEGVLGFRVGSHAVPKVSGVG